jgi:PPOX class probable FMN-dependent enzyme
MRLLVEGPEPDRAASSVMLGGATVAALGLARRPARVGGMTPPLTGSAFDSLRLDAVADQEALRRAYDLPGDAALRKQTTELTAQTRQLIGCSPLVLIASADGEGNCDVSPRGGPAGFVSVLDARTVAIPDATGNKRLDTLQNVVATGRAGLLFLIPGRTTTLRVNGLACVSTRPELLSQLTAVGKPPASALVLGIQEVYPHCPKSLLRSAAWKPDQWLSADAQPTSAEVTLAQLRMPELTIADIEQAEADSLKYRYE